MCMTHSVFVSTAATEPTAADIASTSAPAVPTASGSYYRCCLADPSDLIAPEIESLLEIWTFKADQNPQMEQMQVSLSTTAMQTEGHARWCCQKGDQTNKKSGNQGERLGKQDESKKKAPGSE
ncbi:histone-lysine N-methyltransferase SUVR5 [Dorcoceras hygrometricum]|uniref:Histone-lysine N-methyltransferase SUVR5 n=1 Tax=Dorcoceras hygrometricum TaxID=472368 RepID=A0A2Z6ZZQ9_9LAMI|nr:histone-lysine N-methyltransferase SUVR5 [Dorcoceras hygrometricum]